jgi:hypothetical protein
MEGHVAAGLILRFSAVGRADYDAVNAKLDMDMNAGTGDWPPGLLSHAAGTADDGSFIVMEVWESREAQGAFMQSRLGPALQQAGVTAVPTITWIDLFAYSTHKPQL